MTERKRILWANLSASIDAAELAAEEATCKLEREGWEQQALWLRELRARRIAMGREPDDERNAAADMCSCVVGHSGKRRPPALWGTEKAPFRDGCPLHPRPRNCDGEPATNRD